MNFHPVYPSTSPCEVDVTVTLKLTIPMDLVPAGAYPEAVEAMRLEFMPLIRQHIAVGELEGDEFKIDDIRTP